MYDIYKKNICGALRAIDMFVFNTYIIYLFERNKKISLMIALVVALSAFLHLQWLRLYSRAEKAAYSKSRQDFIIEFNLYCKRSDSIEKHASKTAVTVIV